MLPTSSELPIFGYPHYRVQNPSSNLLYLTICYDTSRLQESIPIFACAHYGTPISLKSSPIIFDTRPHPSRKYLHAAIQILTCVYSYSLVHTFSPVSTLLRFQHIILLPSIFTLLAYEFP